MSDVEQARQQWIQERPKFDAFAILIQKRIEPLIRVLGVWFELSSRAKELDSLVKKLVLKSEHSYATLPDKVGVRAVIRYRTDIDRIVQGIVTHFDTEPPDDKVKKLGTEKVGYQSVHIDWVRLKKEDASAAHFPPSEFWAEVQIRTLAQHLWSEMSHDSVYKNDEMISKLSDDVKRRVNLMSGQIEVADREFDRLNTELADGGAGHLLHALERHYYRYSSRRPNLELTMRVINTFLPHLGQNLPQFTNRLNDFLLTKHDVLQAVFHQASEKGLENTSAFIFQPEVMLLYDQLDSNRDETRRIWSSVFPDSELERIALAFGISLD